MSERVLVCGGAGYIGAHMVRRLLRDGHAVVVLDNLSTGHRAAVGDAELIDADLLDTEALQRAFAASAFDCVMHFAARSLVGESMARPYDYYRGNVVGTLNLLAAMQHAGVGRVIFSSTAAVFGMPQSRLIDESHPTDPINPYGASKLMVERVLADAARAHGVRSVCLRYFNAAGASPDGGIGESHTPETHLVPLAIGAVLRDTRRLKVFGTDYDTPDGTCVRDYVHVDDLADAHVRAMELTAHAEGAHAFNLGNGAGFSVREVIDAVARISGRDVPFDDAPRRAGDPPVLVASSARAREVLGWAPAYVDLDAIVRTAWDWHRAPAY